MIVKNNKFRNRLKYHIGTDVVFLSKDSSPLPEGGGEGCFELLAGTAAPAVSIVLVIVIVVGVVGGEKLLHGELDFAEDLTGVILTAAAVALFVGNAIVIGGNEQLRIALQPNDGELPQSQIDPASIVTEVEVVAKAGPDGIGDLAAVAVTAVPVAAIHKLHAQNEGIDGFHHSGGQIALEQILLVQTAKDRFRAEDFGSTLAPEQNGTLIEDGQTRDGNGTAGTDKRIGGDTIEIAYVHGVETAVEGDRFHIDVGIQQFGLAGFNADCTIDGRLGSFCGIEPQVFNAVFV